MLGFISVHPLQVQHLCQMAYFGIATSALLRVSAVVVHLVKAGCRSTDPSAAIEYNNLHPATFPTSPFTLYTQNSLQFLVSWTCTHVGFMYPILIPGLLDARSLARRSIMGSCNLAYRQWLRFTTREPQRTREYILEIYVAS